ncbi:MAG: competence/damage-inducible protein A [Caldithrix sp. RBG_13_44_9]|nr:MAG: competence/damage-inducible protein A [Caldithrix sp. RBG_13_44_9]
MDKKAEIISIGNELLNGNTVNTNASYMARRLHENGMPVTWIQTVRDEAGAIQAALDIALKRSQVILVTGGLGPTHDDITKQVLADYFRSQLVFHEEIFEKIKKRFEKRGLQMPELNRGMALVPHNAEIIPNNLGTAPGLIFKRDSQLIFVMPGVPRELEAMIELTVIPRLRQECPECRVQTDIFRTTGITESAFYEKIAQELSFFPQYEIAFLPKVTGVDLRVVRQSEEVQNHEIFEKFKNVLYNAVGEFIYTTQELELEAILGNMLRGKKLTIAVAESLTGGLIQDKLTAVPGSSEYFLGGVVAYSNASKVKLLGVLQQSLDEHGAVSEQVAREMAAGVREKFTSHIGLSTTGIAGPTGTTIAKPVGLVYIGVAYQSTMLVRKYQFGVDRLMNKQRAAQAGLELVRRMIAGLPYE